MRYGILSDIHGNIRALEIVLSALKEEGVDESYCAGDIVGYGASPQQCIEKLKESGAVCVAGNHDWAAAAKMDLQYFSPMAKEAILWTQNHLSDEDKVFLSGLELLLAQKDFLMVHATLFEPHFFHYLFEERQAQAMFRLMSEDVVFVGHTHLPGIFIRDGSRVRYHSDKDPLTLQEGCQYIINAGSVGQPRDRNPFSSYCVFDSQKKTVIIKRVPYDVEGAQKDILEAGLPPFLAFRLGKGQ